MSENKGDGKCYIECCMAKRAYHCYDVYKSRYFGLCICSFYELI